ncbi:MAG: cobalamin biosynthesis protein CbiA [Candidatus Zixiibacteriota bacterium]
MADLEGAMAVLMVSSAKRFKTPTFTRDILIIVGSYGSGKSEVAINLAGHLAVTGNQPVAIADLDIVNPYFRSREAEEELESLGVATLNPKGGYRHADLPIILPEISGAIKKRDGKVVLDVGGDDVGARILSYLADAFQPGQYDLLLVLNANRPFTENVEGCLKMMQDIETSSRLKFTGIISNTHLLTETTAETVLSGLHLAESLRKTTGLPIVLLSALDDILAQMEPSQINVPVLPLNRLLLKPWERPKGKG